MKLTRNEHGKLLVDGEPVYVMYMKGRLVQEQESRGEEWSRFVYKGPYGVVVAVKVNEELRFGFSQVNMDMEDEFNKDKSLQIAVGRALTHPELKAPFTEFIVGGETQKVPQNARLYLDYIHRKLTLPDKQKPSSKLMKLLSLRHKK